MSPFGDWAFDEGGDARQLLADILHYPEQDHSERVRAALPGGIRVGHVKCLVDLVEQVARQRWSGMWRSTVRKDQSNMFHMLLFQLLGGHGAKRWAPTDETHTFTVALRNHEHRRAQALAAQAKAASVCAKYKVCMTSS